MIRWLKNSVRKWLGMDSLEDQERHAAVLIEMAERCERDSANSILKVSAYTFGNETCFRTHDPE